MMIPKNAFSDAVIRLIESLTPSSSSAAFLNSFSPHPLSCMCTMLPWHMLMIFTVLIFVETIPLRQ